MIPQGGGPGARQAVRVRAAGDAALLLEFEPVIDAAVNARAIAAAEALRRAALAGVRDVVSTFRSVAVYFDPLVTDVDVLRGRLEAAGREPGAVSGGREVRVPVVYGGDAGPDLEDVAAFARLTPAQVVERHAAVAYRVFMLGFQPGFAYMGVVPQEIAAPRRATPRLRVPGGSVAIAGLQTAVYPRESPGGWQIIGRTAVRLFDPANTPAALLAPGDAVRFVPCQDAPAAEGSSAPAVRRTVAPSTAGGDRPGGGRHVTVIRPGLLTTVQDGGRWGHLSSGVSASGAIDPVSHRVANAVAGNDRDAATLEVTLAGPELRIDGDTVVALAGADLGATIDGARVPLNRPVLGRHGSVLRFADRRSGTRTYVAFAGGIAVPPVLGSRATHLPTQCGGVQGRALAAGDRLPLGSPGHAPPARTAAPPEVVSGGGVRVRVMPGPQEEWFPPAAFDALQRTRFTVGPDSNRMGYRLTGGRIPRIADREMISDATFPGAIQVPASGEPILLMADRQTTGGYPQLAVIVTADLPRAGQLAPGDWIEFEICSRAEAIAALVAQEGKLLAIG